MTSLWSLPESSGIRSSAGGHPGNAGVSEVPSIIALAWLVRGPVRSSTETVSRPVVITSSTSRGFTQLTQVSADKRKISLLLLSSSDETQRGLTVSCGKTPGKIPAASCRPESQNVRHSFSPGSLFCQYQSLCSLRGINSQNSLDMALFRSPDNLCQCCQNLMDLLKLLYLTDCRIYSG